MSELSPRQKIFCESYAETGNATEAAKAAGYSPKTAYSQGQRLLKNVEVQRYIRRLQDQAAKGRLLSIVRVKSFLSDVITDPEQRTSDRLKASDMYLRSAGAYMHIRPDPDSPSGFAFAESDGEDVLIVLPPVEKSAEDDELETETIEELKNNGWSVIK